MLRQVHRAASVITLAALTAALGSCSKEPAVPLGTLSPEQAVALINERDEARDALAKREREMQAEIDSLRAELQSMGHGGGGDSFDSTERSADVSPVPETSTETAVDLVGVSAKPIRTSGSYTYFSWQARVRNNLDRPISVSVYVSFQDSDGFELDDSLERVSLQPSEERAITGVEMIENESARRVSKVGGRIEM